MDGAAEHASKRPILIAGAGQRLFGREREQHDLVALLERSPAGPVAVVEGEPGIGKTALIEWTLAEAARRRFQCLHGQCYPLRDAGPYLPFFQILNGLRRSDKAAKEASRLLSTAPLGVPGSAWLGRDARAERVSHLRLLGDQIIRVAANAPTVLVVDDLQWADVGTLLVLNHLVDVNVPGLVLLLATRRADGSEAETLQLTHRLKLKAPVLELPGLDTQAAAELVESELGPGQLSRFEVERLTSFTEGNPLFLRELITHFKRQGSLGHDAVDDLLRKDSMPAGLSGILRLRLRRLPETLSRVLSSAAVLIEPFRPELIARLSGLAVDQACNELEAGVSERILRRYNDAGPAKYDFVHDLYRKEFSERLSAIERRKLHARVAEAVRQGIVVLDIAQQARHAALGVGAGDRAEAVLACRQAAEQAERLLAFEEAARCWELALECAPVDLALEAECWRRLGWALWAAGKWPQAIAAWKEAAGRYEGLGDQKRLAEVSLALADVHRWRIELDDARRWAERAASLGQASVDERALAAALLGNAYALQNRRVEAAPLLEQALAYWREGAHPSATWWIAHGFLMLGELRRAHELSVEGLAEAQRLGATNVAALLASGLLVNDLSFDRDAAREHLRVLEENTNGYDVAARLTLLDCQALFYGSMGDWGRVLEQIDDWTANFRLAGPYQIANARMIGAAALLALARPSEAEQQIRSALPNIEAQLPSAKLYLAQARLRQGDAAEATALVAEVADDVLEQPRLAATRGVLGHLASHLANEVLWSRCYEGLSSERRPLVMVFHCTSVQRVLGRLAASLRNWSPAIDHFELALEQMEKLEARAELAVALDDYARLRRARRRRGDETKAEALESRASELYLRLGMPADGAASGAQSRTNKFGLSTRELEVLELAALGLRNREIADRLSLSDRTVQRHLENIFGKMAVEGRTEAVIRAVEHGLISVGKPLAPIPAQR